MNKKEKDALNFALGTILIASIFLIFTSFLTKTPMLSFVAIMISSISVIFVAVFQFVKRNAMKAKYDNIGEVLKMSYPEGYRPEIRVNEEEITRELLESMIGNPVVMSRQFEGMDEETRDRILERRAVGRAMIDEARRMNASYENLREMKRSAIENREIPEFKINQYLILKLIGDKTKIFVNGKEFMQCRFLLINIPKGKFREYDEIRSIDDAEQTLGRNLELQTKAKRYQLTPEQEFQGHCSNLQAWYENDYDTRLVHRTLAFPLLKKLTDAGDMKARAVFKKEITNRYLEEPRVREYLNAENYLRYLTPEEIGTLVEDILTKEGRIQLYVRYGKPKGDIRIQQAIQEYERRNRRHHRLYDVIQRDIDERNRMMGLPSLDEIEEELEDEEEDNNE
ncbi:MAG: hypothetical protein ACFFCI_03425 [Promethearchaeota archaeon]